MTPDARRLVERTRTAQGLPPTIDDESTLDRIVTLLKAPQAEVKRSAA